MYQIQGHHHISMITKDIQANNSFYQDILGLRRVKVSVNQDDPTMYHLFYGDKTGSPGTGLTFFEMPAVGQTYRGTNAYSRISLVIPSVDSLIYWKKRLQHFSVPHKEITTYANRQALHFTDEDGLPLVFVVADEKLTDFEPWDESDVPEEHQMRGFGPVEITVRRLAKLTRTLTEIFPYHIVSETKEKTIFQTERGGIFSEIIGKPSDESTERPGRGSIHHLAIRAKNEQELAYWNEQIQKRGFHSSGIVDRYYFKSLYFRDSNGIVFEIATDGPGFTVNEPVETLGEHLDLPPFLEERRSDIQAKLTPLDA